MLLPVLCPSGPWTLDPCSLSLINDRWVGISPLPFPFPFALPVGICCYLLSSAVISVEHTTPDPPRFAVDWSVFRRCSARVVGVVPVISPVVARE